MVATLVTVRTYDEPALYERLARLDRRSKTAFAAACAQRLLPLFDRYARLVGAAELSSRLEMILASAWEVTSGGEADVGGYEAEAIAMVPSDEAPWITETGYAQDAAIAAAYTIRTWLTDDPQEAAWAALQIYNLADYAVQQANPERDLNAPGAEVRIVASGIVQRALAAIDRALEVVESAPSTWHELRAESEAEGRAWAKTLP